MSFTDPRWRIAWTEYQIQVRDWKSRLPAGNCKGGQRRLDAAAHLIWENWASNCENSLDEVFNGATRNLKRWMFSDGCTP